MSRAPAIERIRELHVAGHPQTIAALVGAVAPCTVNALAGGSAAGLSVAGLADLGVPRVAAQGLASLAELAGVIRT